MSKRNAGFTLTEVLIVIAIVGVVLTISIPSIFLIRKKINERLFEGKKSEILIAAELYGKDHDIEEETYIYIYTLIDKEYLDSDIDQNSSNCSGENTSKGCIINPIDDSSLNDEMILIKKSNNRVVAIWNGEENSSVNKELVSLVKDKLKCGVITKDSPCLYDSNNPDNYLYYSGVMWRIIGVYKIDDLEVVKLVTDDNIVWEVST